MLGVPHVPMLFLSSLLGRMPFSMAALGIVLFVEEQTGSFAAAGAVSAAAAVAAGAGLPVLSRAVDRRGQTRLLVATGLVCAAAEGSFVVLGLSGVPIVALAAIAFVAGASTPPLSSCLRGLWPQILEPDDLRAALALDAIVIELVFVAGPLLAAAVVAGASPALLLVLSATFRLAGTLIFAAQPPSRRWRPERRPPGLLGPLASPGLRTILPAALAAGASFGALEVALPAFADEQGSASLAGVIFAAQAVGSAIGGLVYGVRAGRATRTLWLVLLAALAPSIALLALAGSLLEMALLALLSGAVIAPLAASENELAGEVAPAGTVTEAYGWVITALIIGIGAGNAVAGALVERAGWRAGVLIPAGAVAMAAFVAVLRRRTLHPVAATT